MTKGDRTDLYISSGLYKLLLRSQLRPLLLVQCQQEKANCNFKALEESGLWNIPTIETKLITN